MINSRTLEISVGAFMVLGVLALAVLAFQVSGLTLSATRPTYTLTAEFDNIAGLTERARVSLAGVEVGRVSAISLDPVTFRARVNLQIYRDAGQFSEDTIASIQTSGLLGEKYISLSPGGAEELLADGDRIEDTQSSLVLEDLIGKVLSSLTSSSKKD